MGIVTVAKTKRRKKKKNLMIIFRSGALRQWEPIFIGTNKDPTYDERLSWEGRADKMVMMMMMMMVMMMVMKIWMIMMIKMSHLPRTNIQWDQQGSNL